ncbi:hypothetical protein BHE74_00000559 [Ensete ventricosum]|nr:hypothetical protein BHE74_00000559 [Ensete ventricosum]
MTSLSFCDDGVTLDPLLIPTEDKEEKKEGLGGIFFRRIPIASTALSTTPEFHQFLPIPSPESQSLPRSHLPEASDPISFTADEGGLYDADVAVRQSDDRMAGREGDASPSGSRKTTRSELVGVLALLRGMSMDPRNRSMAAAEEEWLETQVLRARETLFQTLDDATRRSEFPPPPEFDVSMFVTPYPLILCGTLYPLVPYANSRTILIIKDFSVYWNFLILVSRQRKLRTGRISTEGSQKKNSGKLGSVEVPTQPKRRSERIAQNANQSIRHLRTRRQRIGFGSNFQADVPDWTSPPSETDVSNYKEDFNTLKWLGTRVWPAEGDDRKICDLVIGKGKQNYCACSFPGSVVCIRSHVSEARLKLKDDLGQAFFAWGFDGMGEEVSQLWTNEEQMSFDALKRLKNESGYNCFWEAASKYFISRIDLHPLVFLRISSHIAPPHLGEERRTPFSSFWGLTRLSNTVVTSLPTPF